MEGKATKNFWKHYEKLPVDVKLHAKDLFNVWKSSPHHRSLQFKQVHSNKPYYSIRIGIHWRALGFLEGKCLYWYWIGSHEDYNKHLRQL